MLHFLNLAIIRRERDKVSIVDDGKSSPARVRELEIASAKRERPSYQWHTAVYINTGSHIRTCAFVLYRFYFLHG